MSHLSHDELLAAAEGRTAPPGHLAACASCRSEVEALAAVLREVTSVQVPEPSPVFWEHFSARVRERTEEEAAGQTPAANQKPGGYTWAWRFAAAAVTAIALLVAGGRLLEWRPSTPAVPARPAAMAQAAAAAATPVSADEAPAADEAWGAFDAVASEADSTGDAFATTAPGLAEDAVLQLTDEERGELIRLLENELARRGARGEG